MKANRITELLEEKKSRKNKTKKKVFFSTKAGIIYPPLKKVKNVDKKEYFTFEPSKFTKNLYSAPLLSIS